MNDDNPASTSTSAPRGTKRKRPDQTAEDPTTKLAGKLHHELKEVRKAAKKARTFETQRVVKKLKGLRKKDPATPEVAVLEAELEELKTIDTDAMAATALRTRLLKDRHIADSEPAQAAIVRELPPAAPAPATTNTNSKVQARLFSHRALGAAVSEAVTGLRAVVLPPKVEGAEDALQLQLETAAGEGEGEGEEGEDDEEEEAEDEEDAAGWESGSVRAGGSESEEDEDEDADADGWESGSVDSDADAAPPPAKKKAAAPKTATKTKTVTPAPTKAKTKPAPTTKPTTPSSNGTSQFLPSLAVGYVRGGSSDSGFEDDVDDVDVGERKNRRGQRARRAIWEKKFGRGANHKKKEAEEAAAVQVATKARWEARKARGEVVDAPAPTSAAGKGSGRASGGRWTESKQVVDGGWGARGGGGAGSATGAASGPGAGGGSGQAQAKPKPVQWQKPAQGQARAGKAAVAGADAGLHPSWAAKKAMKEKMGGTGGAIVPSQGKKIVFA